MQRMRIPLIGGLLAALVIGLALLANGLRTPDAWEGDACAKLARAQAETASQARLAGEAAKKQMLEAWEAEYRQQALELKCGFAAWSVSPTTSATPSSTPSATPTQKAPNADSWKPHYFTLDKGKVSRRAFGPAVTGNLAEVKEEFAERMKADLALLCANGGLILNGEDGGADCVKSLLKSKEARDAYYDEVMDAVKTMKVETLGRQPVKSAYMVVGSDGIPRVLEWSTYRESSYRTLTVTTKSGDVVRFRLECGFQWDTGVPAKGKPGTPTKKPHAPAPECVAGEGRDEEANCKPPKTTPSPSASTSTPPATPTATPTPTPSETPSMTPTPSPSSTPTSTPSCVEKECETAPAAPPNRPTPSTTPTRSPETTPPARPSQPANTTTPPVRAPSASAVPTPTRSVPQAPQPSPTATGSISPPED